MLTMTASLQPLVKETWPLASVHGPGLLASTHAYMSFSVCVCVCVCVTEREKRVGRGCHACFLILLGSS